MINRLSHRKEDLKSLGIASFKSKDFVKSLGYLLLASEHYPTDIQILEWKIKCFYQLKEDGICLKYLSQSDLSSAEMMIVEFKVYLDRHDFAKIVQCSRRVRSMENQSKLKNILDQMLSITSLYNKYLAFKQKQDYQSANECLSQLIGKLPFNENTSKLRIQQLQCLLKCGQLGRAKVIFEYLNPEEKNIQIFCLRIKLYYYLRDEFQYKQLIKRAHELFPQSQCFRKLENIIDETDFSLKQGKLLLQYKKYTEAINILTTGLSIDPFNKLANSFFYLYIAIIYRKMGQKDNAQQNFNKAISFNPNDITIRKQRILFNIECRDYVAAILDYEKLKEIDPTQGQQYQKEIFNLKKLDAANGKQNFYRILNVQRQSQAQQIRKAYKILALKYHPDRNRNKSEVQIAENSYKFMEITEAYKILMDPETRKSYDNSQNSEANEQASQQSKDGDKNQEQMSSSRSSSSQSRKKTDKSNNDSNDDERRSREKKRYNFNEKRQYFRGNRDDYQSKAAGYKSKFDSNNHYFDNTNTRGNYNKSYNRNNSYSDRDRSRKYFGSRQRTH